MRNGVLLGIDIGGTKIGLAVGDGSGALKRKTVLKTDPKRPPDDLLDEALDRLLDLSGQIGEAPRACGLACPGPLSYERGCLLNVPNLPLWQGYAILEHVRRRVGCPVAMMNDANAAVLAEHRFGAARDVRNAVFLTMSTGLGAGLLLDGRVYEGTLALAGEVGHVRLRDDGPVGFGKRGSAEGFLSGPGMVQLARQEILAFRQRGRTTALEDDEALTPERICREARGGDAAALAVTDRVGEELGRLCAILVDLLNPDVIVLGTIGAAWPDLFIPRAREVLEEEAIEAAAKAVRIVPSQLEDRGHLAALAVALLAEEGKHRSARSSRANSASEARSP